jgi:hypothetical protein
MAIPKPDPRDWARANAQELAVTDREVLAMLRDAYRSVNKELADLVARDSPLISAGVKRAQLEQTRARLLAKQGEVFERLGDIVSARRARAAARSQRLSAAADAALLRLVGKGAEAQYLYQSALQVGQRAIDAALARMKLSALPLSERLYRSNLWMDGRLGKLINETLASGLDARSFAKKARDWFNPNTPGGIRYAAMRLARTEINNSFHAMSAAKYADTPWITQVEWHLSRQHPKKDECNPLQEASPYDSGKTPARPHPQCMCVITGKAIDEDDFVENFLKGEYDDYLDKELEEKGWDVKEAKPKTPAAPPKSETARVNPAVPNEAEFSSLGAARLDNIGAEFIYHGDTRKNYLFKGRRVRVEGPRVKGGPYARTLVDAETGELVGQQASNSAKWWIERIERVAPERKVLQGQAAHDSVPKGLFKRGTMTPEQRKSLKTYESGWFVVINGFLRSVRWGEPDYADEERDVNRIDSAMDGSVLPEPIEGWRGLFNARSIFGDRFDNDLSGFAWEDKGYGSMTTDESIIRTFITGLKADENPNAKPVPDSVKMKVRVSAGVKALETSTHTQGSEANGPQAEITLQRDLEWKVVKDNGKDAEGVRHLEVEVGTRAERSGADAATTAGANSSADSAGTIQPERTDSQPATDAGLEERLNRINADAGSNGEVIRKALREQFSVAPKALGNLREVKALKGEESRRFAAEQGRDTVGGYLFREQRMVIQPRVFTSKFEDGFKKELRSGYSSKCGHNHSGVEALIAHECGHLMEDLMSRGSTQKLAPIWKALAGGLGLKPPFFYDERSLNSWVEKNRAELKTGVSGYGVTNSSELIAEIWMEYSTNSEARPHIKAAGEEIRKLAESLS